MHKEKRADEVGYPDLSCDLLCLPALPILPKPLNFSRLGKETKVAIS